MFGILAAYAEAVSCLVQSKCLAEDWLLIVLTVPKTANCADLHGVLGDTGIKIPRIRHVRHLVVWNGSFLEVDRYRMLRLQNNPSSKLHLIDPITL